MLTRLCEQCDYVSREYLALWQRVLAPEEVVTVLNDWERAHEA
jgi:hypothetical protein